MLSFFFHCFCIFCIIFHLLQKILIIKRSLIFRFELNFIDFGKNYILKDFNKNNQIWFLIYNIYKIKKRKRKMGFFLGFFVGIGAGVGFGEYGLNFPLKYQSK